MKYFSICREMVLILQNHSKYLFLIEYHYETQLELITTIETVRIYTSSYMWSIRFLFWFSACCVYLMNAFQIGYITYIVWSWEIVWCMVSTVWAISSNILSVVGRLIMLTKSVPLLISISSLISASTSSVSSVMTKISLAVKLEERKLLHNCQQWSLFWLSNHLHG